MSNKWLERLARHSQSPKSLFMKCVTYLQRERKKRLSVRHAAELHRIHRSTYAKFQRFTMIHESTYLNNLSLCDSVKQVPGCVIECGVWRGGMIAGIAEILGPERHYELFDSFEGLPPAPEIDGPGAQAWQADKTAPSYFDNCAAPRDFADEAMRLSGAKNVAVHPGWFEQSLANYRPPGQIALLRLDGDWYESTVTCLRALYPYMAPGGIIVLDDYQVWDGCSRAVHDYLSANRSVARLRQWRDDVTYIQLPMATAENGKSSGPV